MSESESPLKTIVNIGVGPLVSGQPGVTLVISLNDGTSAMALLGVAPARDLANQIFNTLNPRFSSSGGLQVLEE